MSPKRSLLRVTRLEDRTVPTISLAFVGNFGPVNEGSSVLLVAVAQGNSAGTFYGFDYNNDGVWDEFNVTGVAHHAFPDNGNYQVNVVAGDNTGALTFGSTVVTVLNVPPAITSLETNATTIDRGATVTLTGTVYDPGILDTHTVTVDWGDGSVGLVGVDPATNTFAATHQFVANPSGTATDTFTISAAATDKDGGVSTPVTIGVTVVTPPPFVSGLAAAPIVEGQTATLTGTIADTGANDRFTVVVDWDGDGTVDQTFTDVAAGPFAFSHVYTDDVPGGVPVSVTVTNLGGNTVATTQIDVAGAQPSVTLDPVAGVTAGATATLTGSVSDPGVLDTHTITVDWGDGSVGQFGVDPATRTFAATHQYVANPSGTATNTFTISATATDDDGGVSTPVTTDVTVVTPPPVVSDLAAAPIVEGQTATLTGTIADTGANDRFTVVVDWNGDGTVDQTFTDVAAGPFAFSHVYTDDVPGGVPVSVTVTNLGGSTVATTQIDVANAPPAVTLNPVAAVTAGGTATLTGTIADPGVLDTFTLNVTWGDGSNAQTITLGTNRQFAVQHQYLNSPAGGGAYAITATVTDNSGDPGSATTTVVVNAAASSVSPRGQGYWKTHANAWPVTSLTLGGYVYNQSELLALLGASVGGDARLILAKQLIAAKLNMAAGANASAVQATMSQADALLAGLGGKIIVGRNPVKASTALGWQLTHLAGLLEDYNEEVL